MVSRLSPMHIVKVESFDDGETVNAAFIKRLDDGLRDMSPIHAVIRATGAIDSDSGRGFLTFDSKSVVASNSTLRASVKPGSQQTALTEVCYSPNALTLFHGAIFLLKSDDIMLICGI